MFLYPIVFENILSYIDQHLKLVCFSVYLCMSFLMSVYKARQKGKLIFLWERSPPYHTWYGWLYEHACIDWNNTVTIMRWWWPDLLLSWCIGVYCYTTPQQWIEVVTNLLDTYFRFVWHFFETFFCFVNRGWH